MKRRSSTNPKIQYRCSFCGKGQERVHRLIAGQGGVHICNECVDLCLEIMTEEPNPASEGREPVETELVASEPTAAQTTSDAATDSNAALLEVLDKIRAAVRIQGKIQDQLETLLQEALEKR